MRNLLMISYHFPPEASSGVHRILGFARALPESGWRPLILTLLADRYEPFAPRDEALLERIPDVACVFRTGIIRLLDRLLHLRGGKKRASGSSSTLGQVEGTGSSIAPRRGMLQRFKDGLTGLLSTPDRQIGWLPAACWRALRVARKHPIAALFTSGGPWTTHLVGLVLRPLLAKPWIADFRDPWTQNPWMPPRSRLRKKWELLLESRVVHVADRVVANTTALREDFVRRYEDLSAERFVTITNGYEPDLERRPSFPGAGDDDALIMTHAGNLYYRRDPRSFIRTVGRLIESGKISAGEIRLNFVGQNLIPDLQDGKFLSTQGLDGVVTFLSRVPRQKCLEIQEAAHVLVLIQPETKLQVPAKLYEYLMLGKPILALTSGGATADLVRSEGFGLVADLARPDQIESVVLELYRRFKEGRLRAGYDLQARAKYRFDYLTRELAQVLNEIADSE